MENFVEPCYQLSLTNKWCNIKENEILNMYNWYIVNAKKANEMFNLNLDELINLLNIGKKIKNK